jgi:putative chitinase
MTVSAEQLQKIMPAATPARIANFIGPLNATMEEFGINTPKRQAAFLSQLAHESGSLRYVQEIASGAAYDNRADIGNTRPDAIALAELAGTTPGRYYKGRGLIQITGFDNYLACSRALLRDDALVKNPAMLERADLACRSAGWYWDSRRLNAFADAGQFETITRKINGGLNGQADRLAHYQRALSVLEGGDSAPTESGPFPEQPAQGETVVAPFIAAAIPSLIQAAPALIRLFGNSEQAEKNAKAAEVAVEIAKAVTETPTAEGAVAAMQADPELANTYARAVAAQWYELAGEAGGGGIAGARQADQAAMQQGKPWLSPALWVAMMILPLVYMVSGAVLFGADWTMEIKAMVVSSIISLVLGSVTGFFLGTSYGSQQKTAMLADRR